MRNDPPTATYRLQFNRNFTFKDACRIIPYLNLLGISHVYASPILKARAESKHGYDIVDHHALNPEIGNETDFTQLVDTLHQFDMGLILDIVPNHMGVGGDDNTWWLDVLENGEASEYATYFDIDWHPSIAGLNNKVLLPFLADHYGIVLERGELSLTLNTNTGELGIRYYQHYFPLDPKTYPVLLSYNLDFLARTSNLDRKILALFYELIVDFKKIPRRTESSAVRRKTRKKLKENCKHRLVALCQNSPEIESYLRKNIRLFNGKSGNPKSFDLLHKLLESQAYRLAYWKVASDEINYRRFFDINELAGIRIEKREVFEATHAYITQFIAEGKVNGLRIDHPDGLSDPRQYFSNLQEKISQVLTDNDHTSTYSFYVIIEKILSTNENIPSDWAISGTTGYESAHLINGIFVYPVSEKNLSRTYVRFTGLSEDFDQLLYELKKLVIQNLLASELVILANLATGIAKDCRNSQDFTYHGLRKAISEIAACFPVYRTYVTPQKISNYDKQYIFSAIEKAKKRNLVTDVLIFDFLGDLIKLNDLNRSDAKLRKKMIQFAQRFQQYTAPAMAKGMEDTAFYVYNRLISLNEVGFDPKLFSISIKQFHQQNGLRQKRWPHTLINLSTHDSKRSEDIRARINIISEFPRQWGQHLAYWSRLNHSKKKRSDNTVMPSRNDEYFFYQTLIGAWPLHPIGTVNFTDFKERIENYMLKSIREAKTHTSWRTLDNNYENAMRDFIRATLDRSSNSAFLEDFIPFQTYLTRFGLLNGLAQTLLKLTIPGIPDLYQGSELWSLNLVDPDNRRPVDYPYRKKMLTSMIKTFEQQPDLNIVFDDMLVQIEDGRAKLFLIWKTLNLRRQIPKVFNEGEYIALKTKGENANHICAFIRHKDDKTILVCVPRWFAILNSAAKPEASTSNSTNPKFWEKTWLEVSAQTSNQQYRNILTGDIIESHQQDDGLWLNAADLYRNFPVALLILESPKMREKPPALH